MVVKNKSWGGNWTEKKLDAFEKYVSAYLTIMNKYRQKNHWRLIYFDAFAGSGTRESNEDFDGNGNNLFGLEPNEISLYKGAAERVLNISQEETINKKCEQSIKKIAELYISRLKTIFKEVTEQPLELLNTKGVPIYHFIFASNNATAKKIAKQIIGGNK